MITVNDYISGKVIKDIKLAQDLIKAKGDDIKGSALGDLILMEVDNYAPKLIKISEAMRCIEAADSCALGERVCNEIHKDNHYSETIFLNKLAEGMVSTKRARYVTKKDAVESLQKYGSGPIIIKKTSGEYTEICSSAPGNCVYWNLEKRGLKCLRKE